MRSRNWGAYQIGEYEDRVRYRTAGCGASVRTGLPHHAAIYRTERTAAARVHRVPAGAQRQKMPVVAYLPYGVDS
jgi:hypothetical protein